MAADPNVIKEFLVSLGYEVDGQQKFIDGVTTATKVVAGLTAGLASLVAGAIAASSALERMYFVSQRNNAAVAGIKSLQYAVANLGGTADDALGSVEGLGKFLRTNPGGEGFLNSLGVQTRGAGGQLRDTVDLLKDLGKQFAAMPYYQAERRASFLGIDERTLQALIRGVDQFGAEYDKTAKAVGYNADAAAKSSHDFMVQLRGLGAQADILSKKFFTTFAETLTPVIEKARKWISDNAGLIATAIDRVVRVLGALATLAGTVVSRAIEIFQKLGRVFDELDAPTRELLLLFGGIYAAIKAINLVFSLSPIGRIIALATAILALYDDYKTFKEGGESLIDWGKWEPGINAAINAVKDLANWCQTAFEKAKQLSDQVFGGTAAGDKIGDWTVRALAALGDKDAQAALKERQVTDAGGVLGGGGVRGGDPNAPIGIRQNNPGNLRTGPNGSFGTYSTAAEGLQALGRQLNLYATGRSRAAGGRQLQSVQDIISTYAPPSENNTAAYIADVAKAMGVSPTARLDLGDTDTMALLMRSIVKHENGQNPYSNSQYRAAAGQVLGAAPNIAQTNNYTINGARDTAAVQGAVGRAQDDSNQRLARNMTTAAQ